MFAEKLCKAQAFIRISLKPTFVSLYKDTQQLVAYSLGSIKQPYVSTNKKQAFF
jgi:hypothetical protein